MHNETAQEVGGAGEHEEHPKGALTLALLFGVLLVVIWLAVYFGIFVPRG